MGSTMTIGKRFIITSGILILLSTVLAVVSILGFNSVSTNVTELSTSAIPGIVNSSELRADINDLRGNYLSNISSSNPAEIAKLEQNEAAIKAHIAEDLKNYEPTIVDAQDQANFNKVQAELAAIDQGWQKVLPLSRANKNVEAFQLYQSEVLPDMNSGASVAAAMVTMNKDICAKASASNMRTAKSSWWLALILGIIAVALGIGISWLMVAALNKEMTRAVSELTEGAEQIASAASQVSASSQSLAQGSSEQAASIEETSASSEEINSMSRKNTDNSRSMATLVEQSQQMFRKANGQLEEMVVSMDEINESSGKISKIIKVIDEIAFQTNILALNAAVEAARAGEAGMGFAVVADEVRSLAQRSAQAAKDTALLIEDSISKSNAGKTKVDQVATAIRGITEDSVKIKTLADEVNISSEEQTRGLDQIAKAIGQMEQVTQTTAANAEESAAAAEELNAQSESLRDVVGRLNAMVGGQEIHESRARAPRAAKPHAAHAMVSHVAPSRFAAHASVKTIEHATRPSGGSSAHASSEENGAFPLEAAFKAF